MKKIILFFILIVVYQAQNTPDCLVTSKNIRKKVIVIQPLAYLYESAGGNRIRGKYATLYEFYFVFKHQNANGTEYIQVGRSPYKDSICGFLKRKDVIIWETRLVARPLNTMRAAILFYSTFEDLKKVLKYQEHKPGLPADVVPIAKELHTNKLIVIPPAILETKTVKLENDEEVECYLLVYLQKRSKYVPKIQNSPEEKQQEKEYEKAKEKLENKKVNFVYVIDTTASMFPYIKQAKEAISELTSSFSQLTNNTLFGCVAYRDHVASLEYVVKSIDLTEIGSFQEQFSHIKQATKSSEDYEEAAFDGIMEAIEKNKNKWSSNWNYIIHVGDNSAHLPGSSKNPNNISINDLVDKAKEKNISIISLFIEGEGKEDQKLHYSQCQELSERTGGKLFNINGDTNDIFNFLKEKLKTAEDARILSKETLLHYRDGQLSANQSVEEYWQHKGIPLETLTMTVQALEDVNLKNISRRQKPSANTNFQVNRNGISGGMGYTSNIGRAGDIRLELCVLATKDETRILLSVLLELMSLLDPKTPELLYDNIRNAVLGEYFAKANDSQTLQDWMLQSGLPFMKHSILSIPRNEFKSLSTESRAEMRKSLEPYTKQLSDFLDGENFYKLPGYDLEFGFIPERFLP